MVILQQVRFVLMFLLKLLYLLKGHSNLAAWTSCIMNTLSLDKLNYIQFSTPVINLNEAALNHAPGVVQWPPCILNESYCYDKKNHCAGPVGTTVDYINNITAGRWLRLRFNRHNSSYRVPCFILNRKNVLQRTKYKTFLFLVFFCNHLWFFFDYLYFGIDCLKIWLINWLSHRGTMSGWTLEQAVSLMSLLAPWSNSVILVKFRSWMMKGRWVFQCVPLITTPNMREKTS